jgi:hypothetical protein
MSCYSWQQQVSPLDRVRWLKEQGVYRFSGSSGADVSPLIKVLQRLSLPWHSAAVAVAAALAACAVRYSATDQLAGSQSL